MQISAQVIADSSNPQGDRITTILCTFPRIILAELNTHRVFSRNSASSRAIPYPTMVRSVLENPFIPYAWQQDHRGMQGTEYLDPTTPYSIHEALPKLMEVIGKIFKTEENTLDGEALNFYNNLFLTYENKYLTLEGWWLFMRDKAVEISLLMSVFGLTKQLCNRILEPFMYHTALITSTEWENFFDLRCPQYKFESNFKREDGSMAWKEAFKSKKDVIKHMNPITFDGILTKDMTFTNWLKLNKGQAEIHIMELAEQIWDAMNESTPVRLQPGQWHIPFKEKITKEMFNEAMPDQPDRDGWFERNFLDFQLKASTVMCARTSYTIPEGELSEWTGKKYFVKFAELQESKHASPFEHCNKCMGNIEYRQYCITTPKPGPEILQFSYGWCRNIKGFIQLRAIIGL